MALIKINDVPIEVLAHVLSFAICADDKSYTSLFQISIKWTTALQYIPRAHQLSCIQITKVFVSLCKQAKLKELKSFVAHFNLRLQKHAIENALESTLKCGHLMILKWMLKRFQLLFENLNYHKLFPLICENGHMKLAQWFLRHPDTKKHSLNFSYAFIMCCKKGHLKIAKWLHHIFPKLPIDLYVALEYSCVGGHLAMVKWLNTTFYITDDNAVYGFRYSCQCGQIEIAKFLQRVFNITAEDTIKFMNYLVRLSLTNNHFDLAFWLVAKFPLPPCDNNDDHIGCTDAYNDIYESHKLFLVE